MGRLPEADGARVAIEMKRPGVALMLLWEACRAVEFGGSAVVATTASATPGAAAGQSAGADQ